jgi:hydroxymethylbilane synthase
MEIVIATRGSALALAQSEMVKNVLLQYHPHLSVTLSIIKTTGDKILNSPLSQIGGKGIFTKELEEALLEKRAHIAVHSYKDVPTQLPEGLLISAVLERAPVEDVFISNIKTLTLNELPLGATVATGSLRRKAQLLAHRPDLMIVDIRGNVQTRLQKLKDSTWNGMLLAYAGMSRLGIESQINHIIPVESILPAPAQGAIAIETCIDDHEVRELLDPLHHPATSNAVEAERECLRTFGGGCQIPLGVYARYEGATIRMNVFLSYADGKNPLYLDLRAEQGEKPADFGARAARSLLERGADRIINSLNGDTFTDIMQTM